MKDDLVLKMNNIVKRFPGVLALNDVSIDLIKGEVLGILGENGAGKSTLIKILAGTYIKDAGDIIINNKSAKIRNPGDAIDQGIRVIYQELNTLEDLNVAENIFLGGQITRKAGIINWKEMYSEAKRLLGELEIEIDPKQVVEDLTISQKQLVEIIRAISRKAKILVMDEPTAALGEEDTKKLFKLINKLKQSGISVIYISHRLKEIFEITDRVTVLRDGKKIGTVKTGETCPKDLVNMMVGRDIKEMYPKKKIAPGEVVMQVKGLTAKNIKDISFDLKRGEVLGIFGLLGSGRTSLVNSLFGVETVISGNIKIEGREIMINNPRAAKKKKIGLVPVDRKNDGLALMLGVKENITLANLKEMGKNFIINRKTEKQRTEKWIKKLNIKTPSVDQEVNNLSGGNQQKVVIAKWLESGSNILILHEPTRGVDVGAKVEIYRIIEELCSQGASIIMISSELPEIMSIADRIIVLSKGVIADEFTGDEAEEEKLMHSACK
jgi:ribose transport system ATP-binding protein